MNEVMRAAKNIIEQWEKHDRFRVTEADKAFLIDGMPAEVHLAKAYVERLDVAKRIIGLIEDTGSGTHNTQWWYDTQDDGLTIWEQLEEGINHMLKVHDET